MPLGSAFEYIWAIAPHESAPKPSERDYLRSVHHPPGLFVWAYALNLELRNTGLSPVSISSVWVDHTPQCWYTQRNGAWGKPSCELADLLIVVWDDQNKKAGRALLVQAKRGKSRSRVAVSQASTKKELHLLGAAPKFLLSGQTSVVSGGSPKPLNPKVTCEFQLHHYKGSRLRHCTFLQIKDASAKRWPSNVSSWQTMWPPSSHHETYSEAILGMVAGSANALGRPFINGNMSDDWDRLVTLLINETLATTRGTAKGPRQHTIFHLGSGNIGIGGTGGIQEGEVPASDDPQGISTVFITPEKLG